MVKHFLSILLCGLMLLESLTGCTSGKASEPVEEKANIVINEEVELSASDKAEIRITEGENLAALDGRKLRALAIGQVTAQVKEKGKEYIKTFTVSPYKRVCGAAAKTDFPGPVCVWVDFNGESGKIVHIEIVGMGHPDVISAYGADFAAMQSGREAFYGKKAEDVAADKSLTDALSLAVRDACERFSDPASFSIRPYQSMAVDRYLANSPHFSDRSEDAMILSRVVAAYPANCLQVVESDVVKDEKNTWKSGVIEATFTSGDKEYKVSHHVLQAKSPGIALIEYSFEGETVLDAVEIYENFTLYPEKLPMGSTYGHVVSMPADLSADTLTYRVLGDKAMNFPGGTAGSTIVDVTIDRSTKTIADVRVVFSSDSTYLANEWEYGGNFANVGNSLYGINAFTHKFVGMKADAPVAFYTLSKPKENIVGGTVTDGGVDMVVTGATLTPNAIIAAVNAAIKQFTADAAK